MTTYHQVKEKFKLYGKEKINLSDSLTMLIGPKVEQETVDQISQYRIQQLLGFETVDFIEKGISPVSSARIVAALSLLNQLVEEKVEETFQVKSPSDAAVPFLNISYEQSEVFAAIFLDVKNRILHFEEIFRGTLSSSLVHPRELFKIALKYNAASVIVGHNHPSGQLDPSPEDIEVSKRLVECGKVMGIEILDHLIVSNTEFLSLKEKGYL